jgi:hypothetical protein
MGSVFTVERIRRSLLLMIWFPSWIIYLYVFGFGSLVSWFCIFLKCTGWQGASIGRLPRCTPPCPGAGCGRSHCGGFASVARWTMGPCLVDDIHLYMCIYVCNADSFSPPPWGMILALGAGSRSSMTVGLFTMR